MKYTIIIAIRHLASNRLFTLVNILGTSMGLLAFYVLTVYVLNELSFDKSFTDHSLIYRVNAIHRSPDSEFHWPATPPALMPHIVTHPGISLVTRFYQADFSHRFSYKDNVYIEPRIFYADSTFLEILDFTLIEGDRSTALDHPNSIILTKDAAVKYFGNENPIGKQLILNDTRTLTVTGILENLPATSHLNFSLLASFTTFEIPQGYTEDLTSWRWSSFITYVKLTPQADRHQVESDIKKIWKSNSRVGEGRDIDIHLQQVSKIYLESDQYNHPSVSSIFKVGNSKTITGLIGASILVLIILLFNFTNLTLATLIKRAKNISVQKVIGSGNAQIVSRLFVEGLIIQVCSALIAMIVLFTAESYFKELIGYPVFNQTQVGLLSLALLIIIIFVMAVLSIAYPVLVIKRMKILTILKEGLIVNRYGFSPRQMLIVVQICLTGIMLSTTLIVKKQLQFISNRNLGYERENVVVVRMLGEDLSKYYEQLRNALKNSSSIISVSKGKFAFDGRSGGSSLKQRNQSETEFKSVAVYESYHDFIETMGIQLIAGREFSRDFPNDSIQSIILNQAALQAIGLKLEDAIGTNVTLDNLNKVIVGVVKDFNYSTLHTKIGPMVIVMPYTNPTKLFIRIAPGNIQEHINTMKESWAEVAPGIPFDFNFLDSHLDALYNNERRFSRMVELFALIGIATACIGLGAVSWFNLSLRMKEVAIRKIHGGKTTEVALMLGKQYLTYSFIGILFSIPFTIYIANSWLSEFAYRIGSYIDAMLFSILVLTAIVFLLIGKVSRRIAIANPLKTLRSE